MQLTSTIAWLVDAALREQSLGSTPVVKPTGDPVVDEIAGSNGFVAGRTLSLEG